MIIYLNGTAFNTGAKAIVNTINTMGVMGAGIALEFALRYPDMFKDYKNKCTSREIQTGKVYYYHNSDGTTIINFPTKGHFKYPSRLEWIEQGLIDFAKTYAQHNITSVAFPRLGCANGGLLWSQVQPLMEKYLGQLDIDVYICLDKLPYAEGKEKEMLDRFNSSDIEELSVSVRLTSAQKELLSKNTPFSRFWHIGNLKGIGNKTYSEIFDYFYNNKKSYGQQLSLFDDEL